MANILLRTARNRQGWTQKQLADFANVSLSTVERAEKGESIRPDNVQNLCSCLEANPESLGLFKYIRPGDPNELDALRALEQLYNQSLKELEQKERSYGISHAPLTLKSQVQEYTNALCEVQMRMDMLDTRDNPKEVFMVTSPVVYRVMAPEGKIVVGQKYGESLNTDIIKYSLYALASENAKWLMDLADIERFAVDDCVILTNSHNFVGWSRDEVQTTIADVEIPVPDDLQLVREEKLPAIQRDYFNSSHYRLLSFTPSFSDSDQLEVTLAPLRFWEYYSVTPYFDDPLLEALDGSARSIRQKYGNTTLSFAGTEKGISLIPTPVSIQCIVLTSDNQILLMRRSDSVAFYPGHWSASFEETMNSVGFNRKGEPSNTDDSDFFAGAIRGLDEEFAIPESAVADMKILSLNVEYLTLSTDIIVMINVNMTGDDIRESWMLKAADRDEASKFALLPGDLDSVVKKLFAKNLWHPTARMRLIQYLFHRYGVDDVAKALKAKRK